MSEPQQPELRRSGQNPALDPDARESRLEARRRPADGDDSRPIPADQRSERDGPR